MYIYVFLVLVWNKTRIARKIGYIYIAYILITIKRNKVLLDLSRRRQVFFFIIYDLSKLYTIYYKEKRIQYYEIIIKEYVILYAIPAHPRVSIFVWKYTWSSIIIKLKKKTELPILYNSIQSDLKFTFWQFVHKNIQNGEHFSY